jgi:hypothetical protein
MIPVTKRFPVTIQSHSLDMYRETLNYRNDVERELHAGIQAADVVQVI